MYSCLCDDEYREEFWHCGRCQTDATDDDPEVQTEDCFHCGNSFEIYVPGGSHWYCDERIGDVFCVHSCDECDTAFVVGPSAPPQYLGGSDGEVNHAHPGWWSGEYREDEIWWHCRNCNMIAPQPNDGCDCEDDDGYHENCCRFECLNCPNCFSWFNSLSENLITPFSILLRCEREDCSGSFPGNIWPDEYYCDCCDRNEESSWDDDERDFYCDHCEKLHGDDITECNNAPEGEELHLGWAVGFGCNEFEDEEDEDRKTISTYYINCLRSMYEEQSDLFFQGVDGNCYLTVPCNSCNEPLHARIGVPDLDVMVDDWNGTGEGWNGYDPIPYETVPHIEQVFDVPAPVPKSDFDKSDFDKSDFDKSDFDKSG